MRLSSARQRRSNGLSWSQIVGLPLRFSLGLLSNSFAHDLTASHVKIWCGTKVIGIDFIGDTAFPATELKRMIVADRSERWFDKSCGLNANALADVADNLTAFFYDNGYLNVKVDDPQIKPGDRVMIGIDEGPLYRFGSIAIEGSIGFPKGDLKPLLKMKSGQPFRGSTLEIGALAIADFYSDRG
jgi:outer membrane protein insertion porin family